LATAVCDLVTTGFVYSKEKLPSKYEAFVVLEIQPGKMPTQSAKPATVR